VVGLLAALLAVNARAGIGDGTAEDDSASVSSERRVLTYDDAVEAGIDADFGPNCDTATGRVKLPIAGAPPCVVAAGSAEPDTSARGVTATEITVAVYETQVNPAMRGMLSSSGLSLGGPEARQALEDYQEIFESVAQTYGRTVRAVPLPASGLPTDAVAARNDAIRAAEDVGAFAVIGGPLQTTAFAEELAARGVVCISCVASPPVGLTLDLAPYVISTQIAPDQLAAQLAEFVAVQLAGEVASSAGDELTDRTRSFGLITVERGDGSQGTNAFDEAFAARDVDIVESVSYVADPATANDQAATNVVRLKDAGVTSVVVVADPITLGPLTRAATAQDWYPEWILSGALLADSTFLARTFDQAQWAHAFGISTKTVPTDGSSGAVELYEWYYDSPPPVDEVQATAIVGGMSVLYSLVALTGPDLSPEAVRDGLFRISVPSQGPTEPTVSFGRDLWPYDDYFSVDDVTVIRWDPDAESTDELGRSGRGSYRYVDGGERYLPGQWPSTPYEPSPDDPVSLSVGPADVPPYDPPPGSPAAD